jgi:imidazolonepropionase-like amidohydrolase
MSAEVDHIKLCSSGGVLSQYDKLDSAQFTVPEIRAICDTVDMMVSLLPTTSASDVASADA